MIRKCPVCNNKELTKRNGKLYCPQCGWLDGNGCGLYSL